MIIRSILITFLILAVPALSSQYAYACSCIYAGEFSEYSKGQTVIRGKIRSYGPKLGHGQNLYESMTVTIDEVVQGSFNHSLIKFIGDPGHLCLTYIYSETYPIGSEHLFTVFKEDKEQGLGGCGEVSVSIIDGKVEGTKYTDLNQENWASYSIEYDKFVENLTKPQSLTEVSPLTAPKAVSKSKPWWKFW